MPLSDWIYFSFPYRFLFFRGIVKAAADAAPMVVSRFHYARSKDLTRSPSCPRLSGFLSLAPRLTTRPVVVLTASSTTTTTTTTNSNSSSSSSSTGSH